MHLFMWAGENDNADDIKEFTASIQDAAFIYEALNHRYVGRNCVFGFAEGPQITTVAGSIDAMTAVRSLKIGEDF
jgi:hypothetical protein